MARHLAFALLAALVLGPPYARPARAAPATGVVLYSDARWQRLFLHDGSGVRRLPGDGLAPWPAARRRVRIDGASVVDLGPAEPPVAGPPAASSPGLQWVSLEGVVRRIVSDEDEHVLLRVAAADVVLDVHVPVAPPTAAAGVRPGARVRLRGVLEPAADAWSPPRLWVADWEDAVTIATPRAWDELPRLSVADLRARQPPGVEEEIRLVARTVARSSDRSFRLQDETGALVAELEAPDDVREGASLELRGFVARRLGEAVLVDARWRAAGPPASQVSRRETGLPVLAHASGVRALSRAQAQRGHPVRLEAIATFVWPGGGQLFVEDETGGLYVHVSADTTVAAGDRLVVEGFTAPGGLAPIVTEAKLRRVGAGPLPAAARVSTSRLAAGYDDCRRIEVVGSVRRSVRGEGRDELLLGIEGQRIPVRVLDGDAGGLHLPVDTRVRLRAVCATAFNWRGVFDHVELFVSGPADVVVEERPGDPSTLPLVPARDLLRSQEKGRWDRLVRTRGVVLYQREGRVLYLRGLAGTVVAQTTALEPLEPGEEVDVVGFPVAGAAGARLQDAAVRRVSRGRPPLPVVVNGLDALGRALDGELARFEATLLETVRHRSGTGLLLQAADRVIEARGDGDLEAPPDGSVLDVTGILLADDRGDDGGAQLRVVLRSPADVHVLAQPPWLTPRRAAWIVAGLAAAALVALSWVRTLRRRVRARTAELRATEERYRLLADNASDVIVTTDRNLRLTYVSPSVTRDSGYTIEEALAMPLERALSPQSWALLRSALGRDGASRAPAELELEILRKDGTSRWMHVRTSALRAPNGSLTGFLAAARDVTARRQAQQELARLAAAIEQSVDAIVLTDPAGAILYVNPAFERVTGYASAEVLGRTAAVLKSGAHDRAFYQALWATLGAGRTWEGRFTNKRKDGRLFLEDASIAPVRDAAGRLAGYVAVKRDVTRQVQLEDRLVQAEKMEAIGRLAAGIAHDFNNTLAIILNLSDLALKGRRVDERIATCIEGMREAALRAGGLTRQILTFSRQSPPAVETVDPRAVVAGAARMLRLLVPPAVEVRERLESQALLAADATQLQQVVLNLGTNAGLAMPAAGGTIEIALEDVLVDAAFADAHRPLRPGDGLRLVVRDDGYGMRPETVARIFEPFFTTRGARGGTGMGLAVVHGIVQSHGGAITVDSELGRGSTFCVYLPALPRATVSAATREAAAPS